MAQTPKSFTDIQKQIGDNISRLSTMFMEVSAMVKTGGNSADIQKKIDKLFMVVMDSHRSLGNEISSMTTRDEKMEERYNLLLEEKRRLEVLYTSGIVFSSETEMQTLMEKAIDIVVHELKADAGFIVLTDAKAEVESVYARNMNPNDVTAKEMSMSVIRNTIGHSAPTQVNDINTEVQFSKQHSIVKLGITAVVCVPLVSGQRVLGAVYLDRRNKNLPFTETDLVFLLAFARQIVRGLAVSSEIAALEQKLLAEAAMNFDDLRKEFNCADIIGSSKKLFDVLKVASKISPTDASVVILGENGTGKDLLAHAIHRNSTRSDKPFVTINCGAIPADLLESELFGYDTGAFTGATKSKPGKLELADGGTVFFDEIGELSTNLQAKLLRVIQTKEIERLGSVLPKKIDVRILSATNKNIKEMIAKGEFREDLYYRLKVIELAMPPLRERREDIADLADTFLKKYSTSSALNISPEALDILEQYAWHGNVRELENVIHRCAVLVKNNTVEVSDLPPELIQQAEQEPGIKVGKPLLDAETEFRRMYIIKTLRKCGSVAEAAKELGINRTHFYKLLSQLEIEY
jgi:Nif-specific regulatory protein